jgi:hypothetical protein
MVMAWMECRSTRKESSKGLNLNQQGIDTEASVGKAMFKV